MCGMDAGVGTLHATRLLLGRLQISALIVFPAPLLSCRLGDGTGLLIATGVAVSE